MRHVETRLGANKPAFCVLALFFRLLRAVAAAVAAALALAMGYTRTCRSVSIGVVVSFSRQHLQVVLQICTDVTTGRER
jgi:anti-sigma-K factor RskA